jgi:hypothetical protein
MSNEHRQEGQKDDVVVTRLGIVGVHLFWMFVGPLALGFLLFSIVQSGIGWLTGLDMASLLVVVMMLCARWIDPRSCQATTVYGEPSTWATFQRCSLLGDVL